MSAKKSGKKGHARREPRSKQPSVQWFPRGFAHQIDRMIAQGKAPNGCVMLRPDDLSTLESVSAWLNTLPETIDYPLEVTPDGAVLNAVERVASSYTSNECATRVMRILKRRRVLRRRRPSVEGNEHE